MSRQRNRKRKKRQLVRQPKRLSTRQRWGWGALFAIGFALLLSPYVAHTVEHPDPVKVVVLSLISISGVYLFIVALKHH